MTALHPAILPRIGQLVRLMSSDHDGEVLASARALGRLLRSTGADWHALADRLEHKPEPVVRIEYREPRRRSGPLTWGQHHRTAIADALRDGVAFGLFTKWETDFVASIRPTILAGGNVSGKQIIIIDRLLAKIHEAGA